MSCWFCVFWADCENAHDPIERQEGFCTINPEWTTTTGDHHCSRIVYRENNLSDRTWAREMMVQRDECGAELRKEKNERIRLQKQNKELRKKLKEAKF